MSPAPCRHDETPQHLFDGRDRMLGLPGRFEVVRCPRCGLAYTLPDMSAQQLSRHYSDEYLPHLAATERRTLRARAGARWDALREGLRTRYGAFRAVADRPPGRLLDVGCGRGDLAAWFAARGWSAFGVEPSRDACRQARALGVEVHQGTLADAPFEPGSFDAIVFNHSLEHVPDPLGDLERARRLLHPGGVIQVSVPNFGGRQRRLFGTHWFHLDLPRHRQHFDPKTLTELARRAGLTPARVRTSTSMVGLPGSLIYRRGRQGTPPGWAMYATYPLSSALGASGGGDLLHLTATSGSDPAPSAPR